MILPTSTLLLAAAFEAPGFVAADFVAAGCAAADFVAADFAAAGCAAADFAAADFAAVGLVFAGAGFGAGVWAIRRAGAINSRKRIFIE